VERPERLILLHSNYNLYQIPTILFGGNLFFNVFRSSDLSYDAGVVGDRKLMVGVGVVDYLTVAGALYLIDDAKVQHSFVTCKVLPLP